MARIAHCFVAAGIALTSCRRVEEPPHDRPLAVTSSPPASRPPPLPEVTRLLSLPGSAYQATLFVDGEAIELLTSTAAYRLVPGEEPVRKVLDLGFAATVTSQSYVYWSKGVIWSATRRGSGSEGPERLIAVTEQPQRLVASRAGTELAWLEHSANDRSTILQLVDRRAKRLYGSPGSIDALTLIGDSVFFIERPTRGDWRVGRVALGTGSVTFTSEKTGRWPAMLGGSQELVFYDGRQREVVALSPDLQRERTLAKDFICSPFTVATQVYCASLDGIFEVTGGSEPRRIVAGSSHVVASLAAHGDRLAFVSDVGEHGEDRLAVSSVSLAPPH